ncbi:iron chelate uptake ABC transporter family permease subunit [Rhodobacteraceae bacterium B1Z28]|uniref:Iron chelate uptake ABC transporter family permease subunit n=1 Tax=Ruegeria haliotis TaxID=2747601 RepID=A0ABX2PRG0_9RHOB|nr:iron chelate uptake ABC transporter family permease subunit [Ruegeria haliotis]NVO56739.1 iron chelate uptake ABC transporter family permease subunit [Ruegeria haliotis]
MAKWLCLIALAFLASASLFVGVIDLRQVAPDEVWPLIRDSRFPRTVATLLTGASLAIAGQIMQQIARNRFVEPMTSGTGQSAALGILMTAVFFPTAPIGIKMGLASGAALAGSVLFFAIIRRLPPTQPLLVPLVGLIYGGIVGAGVTYVAYQADMLQFIEIWMNGEFSGTLRGRYELLWLAGLAAALTYLVADQFSIIGLGEVVSLNLGLNYRQVVMLGLVMISVVAGLTVVTVGMIPFVGLVVPNLVSLLAGDNLRRTLPITAMAGAGLVLAADLAGRLVIYPFEMPVGTVIGIVGAVAFLWLLYGGSRLAR